ncbi:MAG: DegV family protein [Cellulosilyticaceae bacterium]
MEKIALITDSCCDLTQDSLEKFNIAMFPIRVIYKNKEYLDKIEISAEELYESLAQEIPSTSLPDFQYCENVISELKAEGYTHFIIVTVSSNLSGTHNATRLMMEDKDVPHYIFDSKALGYPQGVMALEVSKLIAKGLSFDEVISELEDVRTRTHGYIALDTLEYLKKGGRIGKVTATLGELLSLRPIISYNEEGVLYSYAKARGKKQAINKVKTIILSYLDQSPCRLWVLQGAAYEEGLALMKELENHPNLLEISLQTVGPSMGIHTGPGVVGFALLEEPSK